MFKYIPYFEKKKKRSIIETRVSKIVYDKMLQYEMANLVLDFSFSCRSQVKYKKNIKPHIDTLSRWLNENDGFSLQRIQEKDDKKKIIQFRTNKIKCLTS